MGAKPDSDKRLTVTIVRPSGAPEEQRRRRAEALQALEGMWKNRSDIPLDGVEYQKQARSEWR
jgi:hypothetical protein